MWTATTCRKAAPRSSRWSRISSAGSTYARAMGNSCGGSGRRRGGPRVASCSKAEESHVAFKVLGEGRRDVVLMSSWISQIEHLWELPSAPRFLRRLPSSSRLILFDKRGSGLSDRVQGTPSIDERMDDIRAV